MSIPSRRLERPPAAPAAHGSCLVNAAKLAFARTHLRGVALGLLCIRVRIGGAHRNRTDQAICLQGKSGFLARTPGIRVAYGNDSVDSHSLAAFIDNFTVGTAGWTRTTFAPLKRRDSRPLSYDGIGWCSVLESNQAGLLRREGYSLAGVRPRLTLRWYPVQIECLRHSVCRTDALHV